MDLIVKLGTLLGLSFVSGVNLYATVAVVGICEKYELVHGLPPAFHVLSHDAVIFVALLLYTMEFLIDKVPWLDSLWDFIHTLIRPVGGAVLALMQFDNVSPGLEVIIFVIGAAVASAAHVTKAGIRLVINTSPEPFLNLMASVCEDIGAIGLAYLSIAYPVSAFVLTATCLVLIAFFLPMIVRASRMLFSALLFKLKCLMYKEAAWTTSRSLPFFFDMFLDSQKDADEKFIWSGRAFAIRIPGLPKYSQVHVAITSKAIRCLYRRWYRTQARVIPLGDFQHQKCYAGTLLCRWLVRSGKEDWLVYLYQPLSGTLPQDMEYESETNSPVY